MWKTDPNFERSVPVHKGTEKVPPLESKHCPNYSGLVFFTKKLHTYSNIYYSVLNTSFTIFFHFSIHLELTVKEFLTF